MSTIHPTQLPARFAAVSRRRVLQPVLSALAMQGQHLAGLVLCSVVFSAWLFIACSTLPLLAVVFVALLVVGALLPGTAASPRGSPGQPARALLALVFLTGSLAWALALLRLHSLLPGSLRLHVLALFAPLPGRATPDLSP